MAFTYREVKDLYDILADAGATTKSLPEWSAEMAGVTGSDIYDAGLNDNILKRMSVGIDRGLESVPGLIEGGRSLGGGIGSIFGMEDVGREVGATLPRQAVNFLPMMIPGLGPAGKIGTAFLSGIDAYTQSGSPAAGVISGVTSALLPGTANAAEQGVLSFLRNRGLAKGVDEALLPRLVEGRNALGWTRGIGGLPVPTATEKVSELFGRNLLQRGTAEGVGQLAALGLEGVGSVATDLFDGNGVSNPFTAENLLGELIGQVPFSAMHLTGKAFSGSKSRADLLEAAVQKTERSLALQEAAERANERTDVEKIPTVPKPTDVDPQIIEDTNAILSKLGIEREAIKANPTTENVEQLKKITEQEDAAVQTLIQQTGGVGLGVSRRETKLDPKIAIKGTDAVFDPNISRGEGKGFYHVTVTEVPPGTLDANGVEVKPGDRVRFPAGFYDPQENTNLASPEFLLPTSKGKPKFTVVENRPKTERPEVKAPAKTFTEEDKAAWSKGTAKKAPTLEQNKELFELKKQEVQYDFDAIAERRKELDQLEKDASSVGSSSEFLDYLARINEVRERAGYPPIDLASLQKVAVKNKIRGNINAAIALVHETRNMEVAEELGKRKALEEAEKLLGVQENIYALAKDEKSPFREESQKIIDLYNGLSEDSGNRGIIASTGKFWEVVEELSNKHGIKGLAERVQGRIGKLATGEGLKKPEQAKPTHIPIFEPLSKADSATIQLIGTKVLEWLNATTHTENNMRELKVFKDLLLDGDFEPTPDDVIMKAVENGFVSGTIDERGNIEDWSKLEGEEFVAQYKKLGLFDQIGKIREEAYKQNARPSASPRPEAGGIPTRADLVEGLASYDPKTNRLAGKYNLSKLAELTFQQFKNMAGKDKPLEDRELEKLKGLVPAAFDAARNVVNVRLLYQQLTSARPLAPTDIQTKPDIGSTMTSSPSGAKQIKLDVNMQQLMALVGPQMYTKPIQEVAAKELVQNAFDASRAAGATAERPKRIEIITDSVKREMSVKDEGTGMTPEIIQSAFFTIGGTHKTGKIEETSGGLGLAKMAFILGSDRIRLETVKDGKKSVVDASSDEIRSQSFEVKTTPTLERNGTKVTVKIPRSYTNANGEEKTIWFDEDPSFLKQPLIGPVEIVLNGKVLDNGLNLKNWQKDNEFDFSWGTIHVYVDPQRVPYPNFKVLSAGLFQFNIDSYTVFGYGNDDKMPYNFVLDVRPKVKTDNPAYPFNNQREGFRGTIAEDIQAMYNFFQKQAVEQSLLDAKDVFVNLKQLKKTDPTQELTDEELQDFYKQVNARKANTPGPSAAKSKVQQVKFSGNEVTIVYADGETKKEDKQLYVDKSFKPKREVDLDKIVTDMSSMDPTSPNLHNNTNMTTDDIPNAEALITQVGNSLLKFMREFGTLVTRYEELANETTTGWFGGVSFDKSYRGLNMVKPFKAIWFNPGSISRDGMTSPAAAASETLHIFLHEITHVKARTEGAEFTAELANNYARIRANNVPMELYEKSLEKIYLKHWDALKELNDRFQNYNTKNSAASFKSASALGPERTGAEAFDEGAPRVDVSGNEQVSEQGRGGVGGASGADSGLDKLGDILAGKVITSGEGSASPKPEPALQPYEPATESGKLLATQLTTDGHGLVAHLQQSNDPVTKALANDLLKHFPNALRMIKSSVTDAGGNLAYRGEGRDILIDFSPGMLSAASWARENVMLHELIHGLTLHEIEGLDQDNVHNKNLTKIREKLISALPANLRKAYDAAVKSDWHNRWLDSTTEAERDALDAELHDTESGRQILYALMNNQEMTAQGFSSHSFREYMQSVPGVNGAKTGLRAFASWVKELLNIGERVSATAFAEFMDTTHQLMVRGEYFAKLQDYGQKYFESKGVDPQYGKAQTERALGIVMESGRGISRQELVSSLGMGEHKLNQTLLNARKAMESEFAGEDSQFLASLMDESGHENLDDLVETAVAEGKDVGEVLDLLPPASAAFVFEKLRDHKEVLELLSAATKKKGTVNIAQPEKLRAPVLKTLKEIDRVLEKEQEQIEMAEQLAGLDAMEPREFVRKLNRPSAAPRPEKLRTKTEELPPMEFLRKFASPLSWFAEPFTQAAQRIPELAEINTLAHQQKANANVIATQALKPFGMDMSNEGIDVVSEKSVAESQKAFGSPKLMDKINRYIALNNMTNKDKVVVLPGNHPEVQKLMNGLTPEEQAIVHDMVQKHSVSTQTLQAHVLQFMEKEVAVRGAGVIGIENGGKTRDNVVLAGELIRGLLQVRRPETQMLGDAAIKKVQARLTPEAFLNVLQYANEQAERIDLVSQYFKDNPAWSTAQAMERYHFTFLKDGKSRRGQASSIKERDLIVQKAGGKLMETKDTWKGRDDEPFVFPNMSPETARRIQEIDENAIKMMLSKGLLDEEGVAEYRKNISPAQQILREGSAAGGLPLDVVAPARKLGQGAEDLPWMWNHIAHAERTANYWTRRLLRAQRDVYLRDPELTPELQQYAKTHIDNLLQNDPIMSQGIVRTASTWFLGWNLAFNMVNGTQPLVTHAPGLTAITGKPLDSYRRIARAATEVLRSHKNKRFDTKEHDNFMRDAQSDLQRSIGNRDEQEMLEDGVASGLKRMLKKNKPQTLGQRISEGAGAYSRASMYLARAGENFNADIALLAAFDLYRGMVNPETGQNYTYAEAKEKAYQYNQAVNFSGGRAARPVGVYSGRAPALRSAAMIGTALQSYVLGTTATFARYIQHGFMRPKGITPQESFAARKALVQMAATQFAAAGLLGMPFVSGALALLEELFPDLEPNKNVREMVNNFLSSDAENGGAMTDMAMTGLPSMLGWDMQSRLSMGNTLPGVSEVNGFQPENLMGPAVNIVKNFVNGVTGLAAGDGKAGMNFFPPAVRKIVEAGKATLGGEGIRDFRGSPLEDATTGEKLGQFLGFQPKRLSDQNAAGRIARKSDEAASRRQAQERQQMAEEVLKGNFGSVRTKLLQSTQSDKNFDPRAAVRAIARAAEELKFPRDLRREGKKGTDRGEFLRSYSNITSSPSEVERFQFRQQIAQRLGLPATSSRELLEAQMMDQLKAQRPDATRSELRAAVQLALRRSGAQPLLEVEE